MKNILIALLICCSVMFIFSGCAGWPSNQEAKDFWSVHGIWFLLFMTLFPRITMLVATAFPIGFWSWIGWLLCPRLLAAILATHYYWNTNPVLCVITWIVALGATGSTATATTKKASEL